MSALRTFGAVAGTGRRAGPGISVEREFEAALAQSQVAMMLRIQAERLAGLQLDLEDYKARTNSTNRGSQPSHLQPSSCIPGRSFAGSN